MRNYDEPRICLSPNHRLPLPLIAHSPAVTSSLRWIRAYYWRENSNEVDFVLRRGPQLVAIEVKSSLKKTTSTSGMAEFAKRFESASQLVVGEGGGTTE